MNIEVDITEDPTPEEKSENLSDSFENVDERALLVSDIQRFGSPASITLLDSAFKTFKDPSIDGVIGYRIEFGCAVVFGDPVCSKEDAPALALAFAEFCKKEGLKIVYAIVSKEFANTALQNNYKALIEFGEVLSINPQRDPQKGSKGRELRKKVYHSTREGVTVEEYLWQDEKLERSLEEVAVSWLKARQGPQIYMAHLNLFSDRLGKRWFYAKKGNRVVGVLLLNRLEACQGWLLHLLLANPDAPLGTTELLVAKALEQLCQEGCTYATFGVMPGSTLGEIVGLGSFTTWVTRRVFNISKRIFNLDKRKRYWKKFSPDCEPSYFVFSESTIGVREILGIMRSMNVSVY